MLCLPKQFAIILALTGMGLAYSLFSGGAQQLWAEAEIGPGEIRAETARALEVIWVDARSGEDFAANRAPGAVFYDPSDPPGSLANILQQWLADPRPIVVYCTDADCGTSRKVADQLRTNLPEAEIYSLKGGWQAWQE